VRLTKAGTRKTPLRTVKAASPTYQLRIELLDIKPAIWQRMLRVRP